MKNFLWITVLALTIISHGCGSKGEERSSVKDNTMTIPVLQIASQKVELHREYVANIQAVRNVEIYARVSGYLEKVYIDEGKEVRAGQVLFQINSEEFKAQLSKAKANLQNTIAEAKGAELELDRVKLLVDKNIISKTELDVANAKLTAAIAKTNEARSEKSRAAILLSRTRIRAPFAGMVDRIPQRLGSLIGSGTLLTTISDTKKVFAYFNVSENEYLEYVKAQESVRDKVPHVQLELADGTFFDQKGTIETIEGAFDENTGSIAFRASFPNPGKLLKHGSTGTIVITSALDDAILVPQQAAFEIQDRNFVYILGDDNRIFIRSFIPRSRLSGYYLVNSGIKAGETIVAEGLQSLRDSMIIKPKRLAPFHVTTARANTGLDQ